MENKNKWAVRVAGVLIVLGMVMGVLGGVPSVESENFLKEVYPNRNQVFRAALFQFTLVPIYIGFSLLLYPILKRYSLSLSLGFVGFRFVAGTFQLLGVMILPLFVLVSENYLSAGPVDLDRYRSAGELLAWFRDLVNHLGVIMATGLGNVALYIVLYRKRLVPQWLSLWAFLGNALIMLAGFLLLFQSIDVVSPEYGALSTPLVLQEVVLAVWFLTKGLIVKNRAEGKSGK